MFNSRRNQNEPFPGRGQSNSQNRHRSQLSTIIDENFEKTPKGPDKRDDSSPAILGPRITHYSDISQRFSFDGIRNNINNSSPTEAPTEAPTENPTVNLNR